MDTLTGGEADREVQQLVSRVRDCLDVLEYDGASEVARELETVLNSVRGMGVSSRAKCEAFELLANVEMIEFKRGRMSRDRSVSTEKARFFLNKAKDAARS